MLRQHCLSIWRISKARFLELAQEIGETFPRENPTLYFRPSVKNDNAGGPLYSAYEYKKKSLRDKGLLKLSNKCLTRDFEPSESENSKIEWLQTNTSPRDDVITNWEGSFHVRMNLLKAGKKQISVSDYYNKFIALKTNLGAELLETDFEKIHPKKSDLFAHRWNFIADYFTEYFVKPSVIASFDKAEYARLLRLLEPQNKVAPILFLLPCIIPDQSRKRPATSSTENTGTSELSKAERTRLTLQERRNSLFLQIEDAAQFQSAVQEHRMLLRASGESFQPTIVFIGPLEAVESSCVVVNEFIYQVNSPIEAVNLCFKIFWALDCKYPQRANSIWLFLQTAGYKIDANARLNQTIVTLNLNIDKKITAANTSAEATQ
ncbi:uncharacterized protein LOC122860021 [Aphidius gifuensis]|uniref:uncharacterized protein LOC122860021 n=1 Tax=Aphidius gifuensis TaxID=684658 RepID=UPI001CDD25D8|nr:uncharacterized protein LOC122860021 [Aphidius gifuensis]